MDPVLQKLEQAREALEAELSESRKREAELVGELEAKARREAEFRQREAELVGELEAKELVWIEWVNQTIELRPIPYDFTRDDTSRYHSVQVKDTRKWVNFDKDVLDHVARLNSNEPRRTHDFVDLARTTLDSYDGIVHALGSVVGRMLSYRDFGESAARYNKLTSSTSGSSVGDAKARGAEGAKALSMKGGIKADLEVLINNSKVYFIGECKRPGLFRDSAYMSPPQLLPYMECNNFQKSALKQTMAYLDRHDVRYGVLTSFDVSYFIRRCTEAGEGPYDHFEISEGICWDSKRPSPSLIAALHYVLSEAKSDIGVTFRTARVTNSVEVPEERSQKLNEVDSSTRSKDQPSSNEGPAGNTRLASKSRDLPIVGRQQNFVIEEHFHSTSIWTNLYGIVDCGEYKGDIPEEELHLKKSPFARGWSGNVVIGEYNGQKIAVKLVPPNCSRQRALDREAMIYCYLRPLWGRYVPKLVCYGTTVNGEVVFLATEFLPGKTLAESWITPAVATEARAALAMLHSCRVLHRDVRGENVIVSKAGVRLIDFGFSKIVTDRMGQLECEDEMDDFKTMISGRMND